MKKLSKQSDICKQHFEAGAAAAMAIDEAFIHKKLARTTLSKELTRDKFKEIMEARLELELKAVQIVLTESKGYDAAEKWTNEVREIVKLSGAFEEALDELCD